ncbi:solute carrier family 2, facilitated glucose transporter member 8 [Eurytemora carolleeae]|uniref:solute carrier family 2, facilitated glucose transporter member 8 n=1 Tax=Eurytemora carolleeae TaxID=1294199 RepID=UPI000C757393|nr:solute carrier family 2, facilitated glucose transporter member 8 [Eurytemora carolleeae]|eukprot:XP_023335632.1 solute carrier family 2, facilitated glucose transporter member 8-like [Eurytemora affinis]
MGYEMWMQALAALGASLGQATVGHIIPLSSFALPQLLTGEAGPMISVEEGSWFASMYPLGCLSGSILGGIQCDKVGRKKSMIIDCIGFIISFLILAFAESFPLLILGCDWLGMVVDLIV